MVASERREKVRWPEMAKNRAMRCNVLMFTLDHWICPPASTVISYCIFWFVLVSQFQLGMLRTRTHIPELAVVLSVASDCAGCLLCHVTVLPHPPDAVGPIYVRITNVVQL